MTPLLISCRMRGSLRETRDNNRFKMSKADSIATANSLRESNPLRDSEIKNQPLVQLLPTRSARLVQVTES